MNDLISPKVYTDSPTLQIRIPIPRPDLSDLGAKLTCNPVRSFKIEFRLTWSSAITSMIPNPSHGEETGEKGEEKRRDCLRHLTLQSQEF